MAEAAEDLRHNGQQHNEIAGADGQQHNEITGADGQQHNEITGADDQQHTEITGADGQQHTEITGADGQQHTETVMGATSEPTSIFFQNTLLDRCGDQVCIRGRKSKIF